MSYLYTFSLGMNDNNRTMITYNYYCEPELFLADVKGTCPQSRLQNLSGTNESGLPRSEIQG